jgi:hypothetical protein
MKLKSKGSHKEPEKDAVSLRAPPKTSRDLVKRDNKRERSTEKTTARPQTTVPPAVESGRTGRNEQLDSSMEDSEDCVEVEAGEETEAERTVTRRDSHTSVESDRPRLANGVAGGQSEDRGGNQSLPLIPFLTVCFIIFFDIMAGLQLFIIIYF